MITLLARIFATVYGAQFTVSCQTLTMSSSFEKQTYLSHYSLLPELLLQRSLDAARRMDRRNSFQVLTVQLIIIKRWVCNKECLRWTEWELPEAGGSKWKDSPQRT